MFPPADLVRMLTEDRARRCRDAMPRRHPTAVRNAAAAAFRYLADRLDPLGAGRAGGLAAR